MATRFFSRPLSLSLLVAKHSLSLSPSLSHSSTILRLRPLAAVAAHLHSLTPARPTIRCFSTRPTASSLKDPNPNWSNRPPKETILLDGCDFEHWLVVVEPPQGDMIRDDIISNYIKTLAQVVGSEEEARMKIYSVSTRHYFAFGALVSEELSYKLKELPGVRWVLPDSYLDVRAKDYGGEPFINGQAVPYDPKYHAEWVKNNARANERNRRNDRPRNNDRSRNYERSENMQNPNRSGPNRSGPNPASMPPSNTAQMPPNNMRPAPSNNMGPSNMGPNNMGPSNMAPNNMGPSNMGPNNMGPSNMMHNNMGRVPPQNIGYAANNTGGAPNGVRNYQHTGGPQYDNRDMRGPQPPPQQNREFLRNYEPAPGGNNSYQSQNVQARDMPNPLSYN